MRFLTFSDNGTERLGVAADDKVYALPVGATLLGLLREGGDSLRRAGEAALRSRAEEFSPEDLVVLAPIPTPPTIRDYMTFEQHVEGAIRLADPEARVPEQWYTAPIFYFTNPYATVAPTTMCSFLPVRPSSTSSWRSPPLSADQDEISVSLTPRSSSPAT